MNIDKTIIKIRFYLLGTKVILKPWLNNKVVNLNSSDKKIQILSYRSSSFWNWSGFTLLHKCRKHTIYMKDNRYSNLPKVCLVKKVQVQMPDALVAGTGPKSKMFYT